MKHVLAPLLLAAATVASLAALAQDGTVDLPETIEAPEFRDRPPEITAPADDAAPAEEEEAAAEQDATDDGLPRTAPLPVARPAAPPSQSPVETARLDPDPAASQCLADLRLMGVEFEPEASVSTEGGCSLDEPVTVSDLGGDVELREPALVNCATALATARFVRDEVQPAARETFGTEVRWLRQASGFVCRTRHGQARMSEHATGNALDWAAMGLADGREVEVRAHSRGSEEQKFLNRVREAACGPFKTVLGPGSDADHADHFHFDLAQRRNGGTYCR